LANPGPSTDPSRQADLAIGRITYALTAQKQHKPVLLIGAFCLPSASWARHDAIQIGLISQMLALGG
jgi:hypothetical protein